MARSRRRRGVKIPGVSTRTIWLLRALSDRDVLGAVTTAAIGAAINVSRPGADPPSRAELSAARVQRFMQACLALGLAAQEAGRPAAAPAAPARPSPASAAPGWLGMLRERLKLW